MKYFEQKKAIRVYSRNINMAKITTIKPKIETIKTSVGSSVGTERIRGHELQKTRKRIMLRDNYTCRHCGRVTTKGQVDHVIPLYAGGSESDENRQYLCCQCHNKKSAGEEKGRR